MRTIRRISQVLFLSFFIYLFFQATFPYDSIIPVDLFLKADPLIAIITIISTKKFIFNSFIIAFVVFILSIILGRFFCGWVCPLGTLIDISDRFAKKNRKPNKSEQRKYRLWKYSLLMAIILAAIFSVQVIWFFDPIVLITRSFTITLFPLFSFFVEALLNQMLNVGIFEDSLYSLYDSLRGTLIPIDPQFFQKSVIIFLIFLSILLLGLITKRFWCRYLCPLGALLSFVSNLRILKLTVNEECIDCGRCYRDCKMDAINKDYRTNSQIECIECMNCVEICPTDAIKFKVKLKTSPVKYEVSKRRFIYSGLVGLAAIGLTKTGFVNKASASKIIRPPGALPEPEFLDRCVRCHECIKICSTTGKYLQPAFLEGGWESIWTPIGDPQHGYCEFNCNLCSLICPTGAIHSIEIDKKKKLPIGTAQFDKNRCIPWYKNEDCIVCEEHCPVPDKAIKFEVRTVKKPDGTTIKVKFPYVQEDLCIGCGICVAKCRLEAKDGIYLTNYRQQRWGENNSL